MKRVATVFCIVLACVGIALGAYSYSTNMYHFAIVQDAVLYRSGLQGIRRFDNTYRQHPFKSVINIQSLKDVSNQYKSQVEDEKKFCAERQLKFFHIPMDTATSPTAEQIAEFLTIVDEPANRPVVVHDSQGVIREGMMVAVWQMERMGYTPERCLKEANWFGHPASPAVVKFISEYTLQKAAKTAAHAP